MGGKPSRGTAADRRLKANKASMAAAKPAAPAPKPKKGKSQ